MEKLRHYVAMCRDECGDDFRATQEEYAYPEFDEDDEIQLEAFMAWRYAIEQAIDRQMNPECSRVWLERVNREAYGMFWVW